MIYARYQKLLDKPDKITDKNIKTCLQNYVFLIKKIYGDLLTKMVLFGSCARGDNTEYSDVDVMIFLNVAPQEERKNIDKLLDATFDFNMKNGIDIQPIPKSNLTFNKWKNILPLYKSIMREGIAIYE